VRLTQHQSFAPRMIVQIIALLIVKPFQGANKSRDTPGPERFA
jgi:hypothetical protein